MTASRAFWIAAAATALLFAGMAMHAKPLDPPVPAIHFTYRADAFQAILGQWGAEGVSRFRAHLFIDYPLMGAYGAFGYLYAMRFPLPPRAPAAVRSAFPWLLPVAAGTDAIENVLHLYLVDAGAMAWEGLYAVAGAVATAKWGLIVAFLIVAAARLGLRR